MLLISNTHTESHNYCSTHATVLSIFEALFEAITQNFRYWKSFVALRYQYEASIPANEKGDDSIAMFFSLL
jgi:hypothetical protein